MRLEQINDNMIILGKHSAPIRLKINIGEYNKISVGRFLNKLSKIFTEEFPNEDIIVEITR